MRKMLKISSVAAVAILAMTSFSGCSDSCDSGATTPPAVLSSLKAVDGYIVDLSGTPAVAVCADGVAHESSLLVGAEGALSFSGVTLDGTCTITVQANAIVDSNNNGVYDVATDKPAGFVMKAFGDAKYVSPLTSLVVAKKAAGEDVTALAAMVNNYNPVTAAKTIATTNDNDTKKLMEMSEILKTAMLGASMADVAKISTTSLTTAGGDLDTTTIVSALPVAIQTAVTAQATAIQAVIAILPSLDTTKVDVNTLVVLVSDGGETVTEALTTINPTLTVATVILPTADLATVTTLVTTADTSVTTAEEAVATLPAKLSVGSTITFGAKSITLDGTTFTTTVAKGSKVTDFYNVALNSVSASKAFTEQTLALTITMTNLTNLSGATDTVVMKLTNVKLYQNAVTSAIEVKLVAGTTGVIINESVNGVTNSINTTVSSDIINKDLAFNVNTILSKLTDTVDQAAVEARLTSYLAKEKNYTVKIDISGLVSTQLVSDFTTITGAVSVK